MQSLKDNFKARTIPRDFRDLQVWQRSMDLAVLVYDVSRRFPSDERFGLIRQLRRATVSIAANIAEGNGRGHRAEYIHHVYIARGSLMEVFTELELATRLGYLDPTSLAPCFELIDHIGRMLNRLAERLQPR